MATSRDWEELQYTWTEFRRKSGRDMKDLFEQMVDLTNEAAHQNSNLNILYHGLTKLLITVSYINRL